MADAPALKPAPGAPGSQPVEPQPSGPTPSGPAPALVKPASSRGRVRRAALVGAGLAAVLAALVLVSAGTGQFPIAASDIFDSVLRRVNGTAPAGDAVLIDGTLWSVRFPRLMLGILVGAALGMAGALMQGVFGNPLAEPGVIGVGSGAAVGACLVIVLGFDAMTPFALPAAAFIGGLLTTAGVYLLSRGAGRSMVLTLVLTGIAINAVAGAVISFLVFVADTSSREQIIFWQMGSLGGATWTAVGAVAVVMALGTAGALAMSRRLDLLALGEQGARHAGVNVERLRIGAIVCVALLTSAAVAYAGVIGFVGLIVPHALRLVVGPSHRYLIPLSAVGGAVLLSGADLVARTAIAYADLPIGIFTALVGGPVFFLLLRRTLRRQGVL